VTVGFADWKINDFFYSDDSFSIGEFIVFYDKVHSGLQDVSGILFL